MLSTHCMPGIVVGALCALIISFNLLNNWYETGFITFTHTLQIKKRKLLLRKVKYCITCQRGGQGLNPCSGRSKTYPHFLPVSLLFAWSLLGKHRYLTWETSAGKNVSLASCHCISDCRPSRLQSMGERWAKECSKNPDCVSYKQWKTESGWFKQRKAIHSFPELPRK